MRIIESLRDIGIASNIEAVLRERGKIIDRREGHNVFTITGRNLLSKIMGWSALAGTGPLVDVPFTNRRTRWIGVGIGSQLEVTTVTALNQATLADASNFITPIQSVEFPTSTSVRFTKEFGVSEITVTPTPILVTEAGLFADVSPANMGGTEDVGYSGPASTTLDPSVPSNPPICYKAFEGLTKTVDFTLEIRWEFRF